MAAIAEGSRVPRVSLLDSGGKPRSLDEWKGRSVLLFFYPEAGSPGCTKQVCDYRDRIGEMRSMGIEPVGISPDEPEAVARFEKEHDLKLTLLTDQHSRAGVPVAAKAFGVWREKQLYGKTYVGLVRSTFLIGPDGRVRRVWDNVRATGQAERILRDLRAMGDADAGGQPSSHVKKGKTRKAAASKR
ncbi:MAG: peroxiredoxin [Phycisphaeraceae bacterium]|nr:peroxiredoxin [Phycisphaeraceae bacterium]